MCRCHRLFRSRRIEWPWAVASSCVQQPTSRVISAVCAIRRWSSWRSTVASTSTARMRSQSRVDLEQSNSLSPTGGFFALRAHTTECTALRRTGPQRRPVRRPVRAAAYRGIHLGGLCAQPQNWEDVQQ
ncbi:uncharacterized protein LOC119400145 isoform X3 [Rhipicephalus sanguineus]|uniref:uncharacterized protein LOC119400145 isoform X3 n=1 Tax=Rhipicephalus sanguineus TaxID=34632 RepID=UPI0020C2E8A4|nr:uncharacterized protein LOC119400145 isoform X3 [Rhipicephalus sanguineus]